MQSIVYNFIVIDFYNNIDICNLQKEIVKIIRNIWMCLAWSRSKLAVLRIACRG